MDASRPSVAIIGAGFGGIGAALTLRQAGFTDITVIEQAGAIGGVWRDNTYPGAACDVPSSLYSYSFAPMANQLRRYSKQAEIVEYLARVADPVRDRIRLDTRLVQARFHSPTSQWHLDFADGGTMTADVLVPAVGQLNRPHIPAIPGAEQFTGPAFHSARWNHDVDLRGRRIAVIGTGASAVQFVPHVRRDAAKLTVFQRTAPHVLPKRDRPARPRSKFAHRVERLRVWATGEVLTAGLTTWPGLLALIRHATSAHLARQVSDPALRVRLAPTTTPGCKRLLFSNDWYPALAQPNVEVVNDRIAEITPTGLRTADGAHHPADVIIYATGFAASEFLTHFTVLGLNGDSLSDVWADGPFAHLGMTVPGFPNMFLVYGPNTNLGGNSVLTMIESQCRRIVGMLRELTNSGSAYLDIRDDVARAYDREMQTRLAGTVWSRCGSWYRSANGRITTNWPGQVWEYQRRSARIDLTDFHTMAGNIDECRR